MRRTLTLLTLALSASTLSQAHAQSQQAAQALFTEGKWQDAASAALALNTSAGYALAAEATTAGASLVADKKPLFSKAQDYARKAIALDPNNAEAYFELGRAEGRLAQFVGVFQSLSLAKDMKANLDKAVALDPKMAAAYVALGLWNANLDSGGLKGAIAAGQTGAKKANAAPNFEKAIALEPSVITHRVEYANALALMGNKAAARTQLEKAVTMNADTYWLQRDLAAAQALLAKLK